MQEFEINSSCYVNDKFIGTTVAKKATVKLLDDGNYSLENKDINIKTGIEINNAKEYQKLGTYTIPKPDTEEVSGNTSFTGYDYMKKFDTLYVDSNTYPIRLDACLENLCSQVGLTLGNKNFPNNSYMLKGNPFTNRETRKTVLSNLVQLAGGFAEIDVEDGKLYVRNLDVSGEAVETIDGNNYDEFKPNNVFGPVNSVRIQMNSGVDGEETIKEAEGVTDENRCQITIADNYYLTSAEEREAVINGIFNTLNGLTYLPIELSYYGYPWLKLGDKIKVKDKNDKEYVTYVMEHTLKYNGAYSGTIKAIALTKTQQAYKEVLSLKDWRRNTELAVDKINGKITSITEETTENSQKITKTEQDVNGLTTKVSSVEQSVENITNTQNTATGKNIHLEDSSDDLLVSIKVKGSTNQATRSGSNLLTDDFSMSAGGTTPPTVTKLTRQNTPKGLGIVRKITIPANNASEFYSGCRAVTPRATITRKTTSDKYKVSGRIWVKTNLQYMVDYHIYITGAFGTSTFIYNEGLSEGDWKCFELNSFEATIGNDLVVSEFIAIFMKNTSDTEREIQVAEAQINDGVLQDWEQYGASPSPDYRSPIENVEGKNKFSGWVKGKRLNSTTGAEINSNTAATSDYIPVNFNNRAYTISGLTNTLFSYIAIYNSQKQFLGRTGASNYSNLTAYSNSFTSGTSQGTGDIAYVRVTTYENPGATGKIDDIDNLETQLEEGIVATPYVPYNSLEVKVKGKNRFDINSWYDNLEIPSTVNAIIDNSIITFQGTENQNSYFKSIQNWNLKPNTKYTISIDCQTEISGVNYAYFNLANASGHDNQYYGLLRPLMTRSILTKTFITDSEGNFYLKGYVNYPNYSANKLIIYSIQIEEGSTATDYEPYKSQVVTFPLGKEKLMEGSYLASDGMHNTRGKYVFTGEETFTEGTAGVDYYKAYTQAVFKLKKPGISNLKSTHFKAGTIAFGREKNTISGNLENGNLYICIDNTIVNSLSELKTYLVEQYANGTPVIVEYELATEEIVPYTEAQQEVWDKIEQLHTYKNVTNIFSDTELDIVYVRDNGLSDMYETKQNASKNYTKTVEKFAEQKITTDEINQKVAVVNEKLTEYKQNIDSFSFTTENAGGINLIQNSTLENGLDLYHSTTGTVSIEKNIDVKEKTISKSAIKIINGTVITQEINIIPLEDYTFSCLVYKTELTNVTIKIVSDKIEEYQIEAEPETWQKFSANINSSDNSVIIEIICDNNFCYISDRILNKGNAPLGWQRHNGEFKSDNVTINEDGITVTNTNDNMKHVITSSEDKIINTLNGKTEVSFNPDETKMNSTRINEKLTKGKVRETVRDDGTVMVTMDD